MKTLPIYILAASLLAIVLCTSPAAGRAQDLEIDPRPETAEWTSSELHISQPTSPECQRTHPAAAYNGLEAEYLVIWENKWSSSFQDIYAQRVQEDGTLKSHFTVATGAHGDQKSRMSPALAFNSLNGEYLVVYSYDAQGDGVHWEIWGRRVFWNGAWLGPEFQILSWANRGFYFPRVAWNRQHNEYFVVASAYDTQSYKWNDVAGRRVMSDGSTPFPGRAISAQDQVRQPWQGDVAYSREADEYLVVWRQTYNGLDSDVHGARVRGDSGAVVSPPGPFAIAASSAYEEWPAVAADKRGRYLIAWQQGAAGTTDTHVFAREIDTSGISPVIEVPIAADYRSYAPAVAINPTLDLRIISWTAEHNNKYLAYISNWYYPAAASGSGLVASDLESTSTAVATGPTSVFVVYTRTYGSGAHIFGSLWNMAWYKSAYVPLVLR